jgi:quercetin dioxygenase-like cupin family protein
MALHHIESGEVVDLRPQGAVIDQAQSRALFKSGQLEVMRLVLQAGQAMPRHSVPGEITLQCLDGVVEVEVAGHATPLPAGHLMHVRGGVDHALRAVQACAVLVTVVLRASAE